MRLGSFAEALEPQRVGEPLGRVDRHDDRPAAGRGPPAARARRRWWSCRRRPSRSRSMILDVDATSSSALDRRSIAVAATARSGSALDARRAARSASRSSSARPRSVWNRYGRRSWGSGSRSASRSSCSACSSVRCAERGRRRAARRPHRRAAIVPACRGRRFGIGVDARRSRRTTPLTTTGPEAHADPVLEVEGGLDELVDRRLLGQGDEHDLAAVGVGQQLEHVAWPAR